MTQVFVQDMNYFQGGQQFFHVDLIFSLNFYNFREHFDQNIVNRIHMYLNNKYLTFSKKN